MWLLPFGRDVFILFALSSTDRTTRYRQLISSQIVRGIGASNHMSEDRKQTIYNHR